MRDDEDRLWGRISVQKDGCWEFQGAKANGGYGLLMWHGERRRRAHRVAYELVNGPIPPGLHVLHQCDNPPCVNPEHLFVGTQTDNQRDMRAKGRAALPVKDNGGRDGTLKLSPRDVRAIRYLSGYGVTGVALAEAFGVSKGLISRVVRRSRWGHIAD